MSLNPNLIKKDRDTVMDLNSSFLVSGGFNCQTEYLTRIWQHDLKGPNVK